MVDYTIQQYKYRIYGHLINLITIWQRKTNGNTTVTYSWIPIDMFVICTLWWCKYILHVLWKIHMHCTVESTCPEIHTFQTCIVVTSDHTQMISVYRVGRHMLNTKRNKSWFPNREDFPIRKRFTAVSKTVEPKHSKT